MKVISKQDIIKAFKEGKYKRLALLYNYYKEEYFNKGFSAELIAQKITADLGIEVDKKMIYNINHRFLNITPPEAQDSKKDHDRDRKKDQVKEVQTPSLPVKEEPKKPVKIKTDQDKKEEKKEIVFRNADEEKRKNNFDETFKDI